MYKKKLAMETSNNHEDSMESMDSDPLAQEESSPALQNGENKKPKKGTKNKKRTRKTPILKISGSKKKAKKSRTFETPGPDENGEYEVEAIVDHKKEKGKLIYRIRWKGYGPGEDTWLPANELSCKDLLKKYKKKLERENKDVYTVESIIDHRRLHGKIYYRVRWEGYTSKDDTWQVKESLNCNELLKKYHDELNEKILKREEEKLKAKEQAKKANNEYEVEAIMDKRTKKGKTKYLIRWKGFDESDDTWEPEETLNCPDLIRSFNKRKFGKKSKKDVIKIKKPAKKRKRLTDYNSDEDESDDSDDSDYGAKRSRISEEYEVAKILDAKITRDGKWEFFVMWKGYGPESNTWEPEKNLSCTKLINEFLGKNKVPRVIQAKLEKLTEEVTKPKSPRKPPTERKTLTSSAKGLRGRTKGELKTTKNFRLNV